MAKNLEKNPLFFSLKLLKVANTGILLCFWNIFLKEKLKIKLVPLGDLCISIGDFPLFFYIKIDPSLVVLYGAKNAVESAKIDFYTELRRYHF